MKGLTIIGVLGLCSVLTIVLLSATLAVHGVPSPTDDQTAQFQTLMAIVNTQMANESGFGMQTLPLGGIPGTKTAIATLLANMTQTKAYSLRQTATFFFATVTAAAMTPTPACQIGNALFQLLTVRKQIFVR